MGMFEESFTQGCIHAFNRITDLLQGDCTVENIAWRLIVLSWGITPLYPTHIA